MPPTANRTGAALDEILATGATALTRVLPNSANGLNLSLSSSE